MLAITPLTPILTPELSEKLEAFAQLSTEAALRGDTARWDQDYKQLARMTADIVRLVDAKTDLSNSVVTDVNRLLRNQVIIGITNALIDFLADVNTQVKAERKRAKKKW